MKLSGLYKNKFQFAIVTLILAFTCFVVSVPTYFDNSLFNVMASWSQPQFFWQYFSGTFEHGIEPAWFLWVHLSLNLSMLLLFGYMIEKVLGSAKMLLISMTALITNILTFQLYFWNTHEPCCGASAVFYAYGPIAFYIIVKVFLNNKKLVWKQPLWYVYLFEFSAMWILMPIAAPFVTNLFHSIGFIVGLVFLCIWRKTIKNEVDNLILNKEKKTQKISKWYNILWLLPISIMIIILLYWAGCIIV